jgi:hypothetical protein
MSAPKTIAEALKEIQKSLQEAGLVDGDSLEIDQIKKTKKTLFWLSRCEDQDASAKDTFVVYRINSSAAIGHADDSAASRAVTAYIDVWTSKKPDDAKVVAAVDRISKAFEKDEWEFELAGSPFYDISSKRHQLSFSATKKF